MLKVMPSGTSRMAECLQTVTILNTIALKKKPKAKNLLPKKAEVFVLTVFFFSLSKTTSFPVEGSDKVASCRGGFLSGTNSQSLPVALDSILHLTQLS